MKITFTKNGQEFTAEVEQRGVFNVDQPECFKVSVGAYNHINLYIPVTEATVI